MLYSLAKAYFSRICIKFSSSVHHCVFCFCVSVLEKADCTITMADKDLFDLMTGKLEGQKVRVIENS